VANGPRKTEISCGIIMPISQTIGYEPDHWQDVFKLLCEAMKEIENPRIVSSMVSSSAPTAIIQRTIVKNVIETDVVICDTSSLNPNVMFELGLRLAFNKPTVIIHDEAQKSPFDTSIIEYIRYPASLSMYPMRAFKEELKRKVLATYDQSLEAHPPSLLFDGLGIVPATLPGSHEANLESLTAAVYSMQENLARITRDVSNVMRLHDSDRALLYGSPFGMSMPVGPTGIYTPHRPSAGTGVLSSSFVSGGSGPAGPSGPTGPS